jgi:hypothetical protein
VAWDGAQTITMENNCFKVVATGFDANAEVATVIDTTDYTKYFGGRLPKGGQMSMMVERTAGTTDVVAISLQGSIDGTVFRDVIDLTKSTAAATADTLAGCANDNDLLHAPLRYVRILATTVGSGNTLKATAYIQGDPSM